MKTFATRRKELGLVVILSVGLLCGLKIVTSLAQTTLQESAPLPPWKVKKVGPKRLGVKAKEPDLPASPERVIEDQIPSHLPIKVEVNNFNVEPLLRNLEIKVTNTSNKPIYYLDLSLLLPDVLSPNGYPTGFPLKYGRTALIDFQEPVRPEDVPLRPGESFIFKVPEFNLQPFERRLSRMRFQQSEIRKVYLLFHLLNFGDKTGFSTTGGLPVPNIRSGPNSKVSCGEGRREGEGKTVDFTDAQPSLSSATLFQDAFNSASFVKVSIVPKTSLQSNL